MSGPLLRIALLIFPAAWRDRYSSELEQLVLDLTVDGCSLRDSARLVADLALTGLGERIRAHRAAFRAGSVTAGGSLVALLCGAVGLSGSSVPAPGAPIVALSSIRLASNSLLAAGVTVVDYPSWGLPLSFRMQPKRIQVELAPHSDRLVGVSGPPSAIVINPRTLTVVSIRPLPRESVTASGR